MGFTLLGEDPEQAVAFVLDLTDRKRLERTLRHQAEELAEANRMKDEFLAVLSHELRTPLNSILGWSRLLRTRQLDAATITRALETIERNARLQSQLTEDILDVSKMIRGKLRLQPRPVELAPVIQAAIDSMRPAADAKSIHLQFTVQRISQSQNFQVSGDPDRLQQIFWNLLSNAIKFTPNGGRVTIELSAVEDQTGIWTRDHERTDRFLSKDDRSKDGGPSISRDPPVFFSPASTISYAQMTVSDTGKGISSNFCPTCLIGFDKQIQQQRV